MLIGIDASRAVIAKRTGTEVYSLHLIRHLLRLGADHRFRLYFNTPPSPGLFPDLLYCQHRMLPFPRLWTHLRLSFEMLRHPPDVLFVPSHVLPFLHPARSVVTVHDVGYRHYPQAHTAAQRRYLEWSTRYHVHQATYLLVDSAATREDLVAFYGADPARITVAYLGVAPHFQPVREAEHLVAARLKYGVAEPYILYVGTLQPRKNLSRLIQAVARLSDIHSVQLVLAGKKGWLYDDILAQAQRLGIAGQVRFTGFVDEADLAALYSGAALFAMPSLYEGFCMPVLEAMACGTPVICSNVSSLPEVAGDAALTFDPHDVDAMAAAMARALGDRPLRAELVRRGLEQAARFTWQRCARQVLDVLESVYKNDI